MSRRTPITILALLAATAIAGTAGTAGTAHAQPSSSEPPPKTGLSHINGAPIKVGEHSQYYYDYKKWNVSGNPIGMMFGLYNLAVTHAVSSNVAITGDVMVIAPSDSDSSMSQLSVTAPIYFKQMYQSFYIEPGIMMRRFSSNSSSSSDDSTFGPQVLVGWHWSWDSGANVQFAFGMGRNLNRSDREYGEDDVFGTGYFRVGYAF